MPYEHRWGPNYRLGIGLPLEWFTGDQQQHLVANLPTMTVLVEHAAHCNVQLSTQCLQSLLCCSSKTAYHLWECPVQSHEWHLPYSACTRGSPPTLGHGLRNAGPNVGLRRPGTTVSGHHHAVRASGPHGTGGATRHWDGVHRHVLFESQKVWLSHGKAREGLMKAYAGPGGTMAWTLRELQLHQQAERQGVPRAAMN